ncbi:MAG: LiaI-LiaF-like domain-containing protein [Acidobacteriaceae bacterium]
MNRWYQIRRLRGAVILILVGVLALLNQWNVLHWDASWPLFLIVLGLLMLVERAAWTADVRARQEEQDNAAVGAAYTPGQPLGTAAGPASWPPASPSSRVGSGPFVQSQPPTPEDPGREGQ